MHACGAAVKLHFIVSQRAEEKPRERGPGPGPGGGGGGLAPPDLLLGPSPSGPLFPFRQRQLFYNKDVILPHMCTYAI